jgi:hypothetical protein
LLLGAHEKNRAAILNDLVDVVQGILEHFDRLVKINDVDAVASAVNIRLHLGVPTSSLVSKMDAGLEQFLHAKWCCCHVSPGFSSEAAKSRERPKGDPDAQPISCVVFAKEIIPWRYLKTYALFNRPYTCIMFATNLIVASSAIIAFGLFVVVPVVALFTQHQRRMASILHGSGEAEKELVAEIRALRREVADLRQEVRALPAGRSTLP